jgi:hypothetical protein
MESEAVIPLSGIPATDVPFANAFQIAWFVDE